MQTVQLRLYRPHPKQLEFHNSPKRYRIASLGRQAGKSTMCINELAHKAWTRPQTRYWFISPTHAQAKDQYRKLKSSLPKEAVQETWDSELRIEFINSSVIEFKSGEVLDNLRGATLHGAIIDEVRDQHPDLWPMVIRPMLTTTNGFCAFVSTPNGFDAFYDLYNYALSNPDEWATFTAPSTCNPLFTQPEFEAARKIMGEAQFAQEILAEFRDLTSGKVYINAGTHNHSETNPFTANGGLHPILPIVVAMDFNVGFMNWTLGQKRGHQFYWFDELCIQNTHTQEQATALAHKIVELNHKPGVILVGDASGSANKTSAVGQTDYDLICQTLDRFKIPWMNMTPEANPTIRDRVNAVNSSLKDATGAVNMWFHPTRCPMLKKDFERVVWKMSSNSDRIVEDQTKDPSLTHSSSGVGYAVCALSPLQYGQNTGSLRVFIR